MFALPRLFEIFSFPAHRKELSRDLRPSMTLSVGLTKLVSS